MKLLYAKLWLKKYIRYNHDKPYKMRLMNLKIANLSHRVYKGHGLRGHNNRQDIKKILKAYARNELKQYRPSMISRIINYLKILLRKF